ncbi:flavodoxin family protein [Chloroflexota bacterium]
MKVVGIVCSPRKGGNTEILVRETLDAIQEAGGETELITVSGKTINPCDGCRACAKEGVCHINDDMQEIYQQLIQSDGIILGTPVYFNNVSAQAKAVMDRLYALFVHVKLRGKVAGAIVVTRRVGAGNVRSMLYSYFIAHRMLVAGGAIGYGREKGEVREGTGGAPNTSALEEARGLGKAVVSLHQKLS